MDRKKTEAWPKPIGHDRICIRRGLTISRCLYRDEALFIPLAFP